MEIETFRHKVLRLWNGPTNHSNKKIILWFARRLIENDREELTPAMKQAGAIAGFVTHDVAERVYLAMVKAKAKPDIEEVKHE